MNLLHAALVNGTQQWARLGRPSITASTTTGPTPTSGLGRSPLGMAPLGGE